MLLLLALISEYLGCFLRCEVSTYDTQFSMHGRYPAAMSACLVRSCGGGCSCLSCWRRRVGRCCTLATCTWPSWRPSTSAMRQLPLTLPPAMHPLLQPRPHTSRALPSTAHSSGSSHLLMIPCMQLCKCGCWPSRTAFQTSSSSYVTC